MRQYKECTLCGRHCKVDRITGSLGTCGENSTMRIASAMLHKGEEPVLIGKNGSGVIFFSGCGMKCPFCQNIQLSRNKVGFPVETDEFADICLQLEKEGAANINLVTGTHFIPSIRLGLEKAKNLGLSVPVVWNSSGYDRIEALREIAPFIDIYLPDLKTLSSEVELKTLNTKNYIEIAPQAILWMAKQAAADIKQNNMLRGTIIRHLVLPGYIESTKQVLKWASGNLGNRVLYSIMFQYTPLNQPESSGYPSDSPMNRRVSEKEYNMVIDMLSEFGIDNGFVQEYNIGNAWFPDFTNTNPFPSSEARPVWRDGFIQGR